MGTPVSRGQLQPGDLVFFYSPVSHVGMYIGNGQMVHASTSGTAGQGRQPGLDGQLQQRPPHRRLIRPARPARAGDPAREVTGPRRPRAQPALPYELAQRERSGSPRIDAVSARSRRAGRRGRPRASRSPSSSSSGRRGTCCPSRRADAPRSTPPPGCPPRRSRRAESFAAALRPGVPGLARARARRLRRPRAHPARRAGWSARSRRPLGGGWVWQVLLGVLALTVIGRLVTLPLSAYGGGGPAPLRAVDPQLGAVAARRRRLHRDRRRR